MVLHRIKMFFAVQMAMISLEKLALMMMMIIHDNINNGGVDGRMITDLYMLIFNFAQIYLTLLN